MSLFTDASLVLVPSGYKTSKLYSVTPTDGSGDLTFTRSNDTATRVNSAGLIERVRTNVALYSQDWTNWTLFQATATANTTANPLDGAVNADTLTISTSTTGVSYRPVSTGTNLATFSAYLKAGTHDQAAIGFTDGTDFSVNVDLTLGTITGVTSGITGTITSVGSGWYRVTSTRTIVNTSTPNAFVNVIIGTAGDSVIVFGAQAELGDIATDYIATTSSAVSVGPVANLPRLDYSGGASCPRLLLEPQRVNKWYFSESFDNAEWVKTQVNITANAAVSPDGYTNADKMVDTTANDEHRIRASSALFGITTATTFSIFAKAAEYSKFAIADLSNSYLVKFDLSAGTVISTGTGFSNATITSYGNGWYRLAATTSTSATYGYGLLNDAGDFVFFTGTGTKGVYIYGAQAEEGAYATSYIPTIAATTRGADACSKTGISSLIGQTEGVLFVDFVPQNNPVASIQQWLMFLGSGGFYIAIHTTSTGKIRANVAKTTDQCVIDTTYSFVAGTRYKCALAYKENDFAFYVNGVLIGTDTSGTVPAVSTLQNNYNTTAANSTNSVWNQALLFKTRLTNAQLAELTA